MAVELNIGELLKEDEEALKAKRKRLRSFTTALTEVRTANDKAERAAQELLESGDLTRPELARVFQLSKGERSTLIPTAHRRRSAQPSNEVSDSDPQPSDTGSRTDH